MFFATLCGDAPSPEHTGWKAAFVNQDTFGYLASYTRSSIRPPLYGWFAHAATFFVVSTRELLAEARNLITFETDLPAVMEYLSHNPQPALQRIAQAQQIALWSAAIFFVWASARVVPALTVGAVILVLYDGGVLTHGYYTHAIEAKTLYLAGLFVAAGAALLVIVKPTAGTLLFTAIACAALPLNSSSGAFRRFARCSGVPAVCICATAHIGFVRSPPAGRANDLRRCGDIPNCCYLHRPSGAAAFQYLCLVAYRLRTRAGNARGRVGICRMSSRSTTSRQC